MRTYTAPFILAGMTVSSVFLASTSQGAPDPTPDTNASVVFLRTDCDVSGTPLENCFESTTALTTWLWGGGAGDRSPSPSPSDRVTVQAGPGDFEPFECSTANAAQAPLDGHVTVIGSGRGATRFVRKTCTGFSHGGIHVDMCDGLEFASLEATGELGVTWEGDGGARWWDVDLVGFRDEDIASCQGLIMGWYDIPGRGLDTVRTEQFMFGSTIQARGATHGGGGQRTWPLTRSTLISGSTGATFTLRSMGVLPYPDYHSSTWP